MPSAVVSLAGAAAEVPGAVLGLHIASATWGFRGPPGPGVAPAVGEPNLGAAQSLLRRYSFIFLEGLQAG